MPHVLRLVASRVGDGDVALVLLLYFLLRRWL